MRHNILSILIALCALISLAAAAAPASFCKCTCFSNSTIIKLGPEHTPSNDEDPTDMLARAPTSANCNLCNRAFCLSYNLPICKGAEEKDVYTACFQRDSRKDQIIVLLFITATVGLLGWAAVQKVMERRSGVGGAPAPQGQYAPVGGR